MSESDGDRGLRERATTQAEDTLGKLAQDLLTNPLVSGAISRAIDARDRASQAQEVAFGALNLPSAADIERLTRRLRSVSQRLEGIEDGVDRVDESLGRLSDKAVEARLASIEEQLATLTRAVTDLREGLLGSAGHVSLAQERLQVDSAAALAEHSSPASAATGGPPRSDRDAAASGHASGSARSASS